MFKQCKFRDDENDGVIHGGLYDEDEGILICGCCGSIINKDEIYFPQEDNTNKGYDLNNHTHTMIEIYESWVDLSEEITGDNLGPQVATFDSHKADSELKNRDGELIYVLRLLTQDEADLDEVGPMYKIKFMSDDLETDAFQDEISFIPPSRKDKRRYLWD